MLPLMQDATAPSGPASSPGRKRRPPADTPNVNALLGLVQKLMLIGQSLLAELREPASTSDALRLVFRFGSSNLRLILGRITRGLHRAAALEARLRQRAAAGRDLKPSDSSGVQPPSPPGGGRHRRPDPEEQEVALTDAELRRIVQQARRRPVGSVLADLCIEFGLMPGTFETSPELVELLWQLSNAIMQFRGSVDRWHGEGQRYIRRSADVRPISPPASGEAPPASGEAPPLKPSAELPEGASPASPEGMPPPLPHPVPLAAAPP